MRKAKIIFGAFVLLLLLVGVAVFLALRTRVSKNPQRLADGSTLLLKQMVLTSSTYKYAHSSRGRLMRFLSPVLPKFVRDKVPSMSGSFSFGVNGGTNLIVITVNRRMFPGSSSSIGRLRVIGESTNVYDACWGAHTLGMSSETVHGWQVRAFPRRSRNLTLQFLSMEQDGTWSNGAEFEVENPAWGTFPQWKAGNVPAVKTSGNLEVTLAEFRSGERMDRAVRAANPSTVARKTRLLFTFEENGERTENWRVQKLIISDATGNNWFPYLNLVKNEFSWAQGGQVEFFGALWPGEDAWKLDVEITRSGQIPAEDLFHVEIPVPPAKTVSVLTNEWEHQGVSLKLIGLASPETDHAGDLKWTGKWWGDEKEKVYSLVLNLLPGLNGQRLGLASAADQNGNEIKLLEHRGQDDKQQALFLKPAPEARTLRLALSMSQSRFVQFFARPQFVTE